MRRNAQAKAAHYTPAENMRRWKTVLDEPTYSVSSSSRPYDNARAYVTWLRIRQNTCRLSGVLIGTDDDVRRGSKLVVAARSGRTFFRVDPVWSATKASKKFRKAKFSVEFDLSQASGDYATTLDFYLQPSGALWKDKLRIKTRPHSWLTSR